jgi:aminopeptidase N
VSPTGRRCILAVFVAAVTALAACTGVPGDPVPGAPVAPEPERAEPWEQRPVVDLAFDVSDDLATVHGRETLTFTPDVPVCELVLRLWPNKPTSAESGSGMSLTSAVVDGVAAQPVVTAAGAPDSSDGTLVELPLTPCRQPGEPIQAELGFVLALGENAPERVGYSSSAEVAWFATAFPLLSWVRGEGWTRDSAVPLSGETVASEDFRLAQLTVTAPSRYRVLATGTPAGTSGQSGRTTHRFTADAVRDVAVAVGDYDVLERDIGGVRVTLGTPAGGTRVPAEVWAAEIEEVLVELQELLGPYPYPELAVAIAPPQSDGIEFPAALQFGDVDRRGLRSLIAHELAHQWFYALVGNNQARDPWIDEAFATYAQAVVADQRDVYRLDDVPRRLHGHLGEPMSYWAEQGGFGRYEQGVYSQGAAVLLEARDRVGADRFDKAVRGYIATNAYQVTNPADVEAAFAHLPEVVELLDQHGALG